MLITITTGSYIEIRGGRQAVHVGPVSSPARGIQDIQGTCYQPEITPATRYPICKLNLTHLQLQVTSRHLLLLNMIFLI